jgi:arsenate reductase
LPTARPPRVTLSAHLAQLERAGLLRSWREQRRIFYAADTEGCRTLLAFLTEECCSGHPELCGYPDPEAPRRLETACAAGNLAARRAPMHAERVFHVLFLCTGNAARSIMAECILNRLGQGKFQAYSAGSQPKGTIHPYALDLLQHYHYPTEHLRSKSWEEFAGPDAPPVDFVFTVMKPPRKRVRSGQAAHFGHWGR